MLKKLRASYPQYDQSITFVLIDWDKFGSHTVSTMRQISRRSTLVLIKGGVEVGRLVAETRKHRIKAFLDIGVQ